MKFGISPIGAGLLGLGEGFFKGLSDYQKQERDLQNRLEAYKYRYGQMASVAALRAHNNQLLQALKMSAMQRNYVRDRIDPNTNEVVRDYHQSLMNPQTNQWEDHVMSSVPLKKLSEAQSKATARPFTYDKGDQKVTEFPDGRVATAPRQLPKPGVSTVSPNAAYNSASKFMEEFQKAPTDQKEATLRAAGIDPDKVTDPAQQYSMLSEWADRKFRDRAAAFGGGGSAPASGAPAAAPSSGSSGNLLDGLERGQDGTWHVKATGQPVQFRKSDGTPFVPAPGTKGGWLPYRPGAQVDPLDQAAQEGSVADTSGGNDDIMNPQSNDDAVNQQIAGLGGEDNSRDEEMPDYEDEEQQT